MVGACWPAQARARHLSAGPGRPAGGPGLVPAQAGPRLQNQKLEAAASASDRLPVPVPQSSLSRRQHTAACEA